MLATEAYVLREVGKVPSLETVKVDPELRFGQVLVEMHFVGLCATQIHEIFIATRNHSYMPHLLGHEGVGQILAVGPGVTTKRVGDICVLHWRRSSVGLNAQPGRYFSNLDRLNAGACVAFSRHVVVPENRLTVKPSGLSELESVTLGCAATTGWGSVFKVAQPSKHESAVVVGLGSVGLSVAIALVEAGLQTWGVDPKPIPDTVVREVGLVDHFASINEAQAFFENQVVNKSPSHLFDTSGSAKVVEWAQAILPTDGAITLIGMPQGSIRPALNTQKVLDGLRIYGSNGGNVDPAEDFDSSANVAARFAEIDRGGLLRVLPFEALSEAVALRDSLLGGKFVFQMGLEQGIC